MCGQRLRLNIPGICLTLLAISYSFLLSGCRGGSRRNFQEFYILEFITPGPAKKLSNAQTLSFIGDILAKNAFTIGVPFEKAPQMLSKYSNEVRNLDQNRFWDRLREIFDKEFLNPKTLQPVSHLDVGYAGFLLGRNAIRKSVAINKTSLTWQDGVPILTIGSFDSGVYNKPEVQDFMAKISTSKKLIINLSDNPGGLVYLLDDFMSYFMPPTQPYAFEITRNIFSEYASSHGTLIPSFDNLFNFLQNRVKDRKHLLHSASIRIPFLGKLAVIINNNTASSAELAAAGLRDVRGAALIGEKTGGNLMTAEAEAYDNGIVIMYPVGDILTLKGEYVEGKGIEPTKPEFNVSESSAIKKAIEYLNIE